MNEVAQTFPKAFAVWFKDLERWDPASFQGITWHWSEEIMTPISEVLRARKEKVDRSRFKFAELQPITIHFDGSIDRRKMNGHRDYTMELFFARPGDIVVAKIDLKNGAVSIVPDDWQNVVVTGHFAVYEPDRSQLLPEYFHRIVQASFFKAYLWRNKVGAEGRKEVKLEFFESLKIPLPPLTIQQAIVTRWQQAQYEAKKSEERVEKLKAEIDARFYADLGLRNPQRTEHPKVFAVLWKDMLRWSVSYNQQAQSGENLTRGKYPVVELGSILELVQYGTSEKASHNEIGTPILRINNIKDRTLDLSKLKHILLPQKVLKSLLLEDRDILIIRTSGSRDLVGTCVVFHGESEYVFASYLIRLRVRDDKADPDFVSWFLNSPLGRQQIDATSRQIMQSNINSEELRSLQIPLPPLAMQRDIIRLVEEGRAEIAREREAATQRARGRSRSRSLHSRHKESRNPFLNSSHHAPCV
jgi:type I restriction enzyme S subunit